MQRSTARRHSPAREGSEQVPDAVADSDVRGRVGQFFNSVEKVMAVVEPEIATYERRDLQRAFLDERGPGGGRDGRPRADIRRAAIPQFRVDAG